MQVLFQTPGFEEKHFLDIFAEEQLTICVLMISVMPSPVVSAFVFMNVSYSADQHSFILNSGNVILAVLFFLKFH